MKTHHGNITAPIPMSKYTVQHFIDKFSAIPDELWCIGEFTNTDNPAQHCAYGHLGCRPDDDECEEANALDRLFRDHKLLVTAVNDDDGTKWTRLQFKQPTPKARILAALESFK